MFQEVAYNMLLTNQRKALHMAISNYYEGTTAAIFHEKKKDELTFKKRFLRFILSLFILCRSFPFYGYVGACL